MAKEMMFKYETKTNIKVQTERQCDQNMRITALVVVWCNAREKNKHMHVRKHKHKHKHQHSCPIRKIVLVLFTYEPNACQIKYKTIIRNTRIFPRFRYVVYRQCNKSF